MALGYLARSFIVLGVVIPRVGAGLGRVFPRQYPADHPGITREELERLPAFRRARSGRRSRCPGAG